MGCKEMTSADLVAFTKDKLVTVALGGVDYRELRFPWELQAAPPLDELYEDVWEEYEVEEGEADVVAAAPAAAVARDVPAEVLGIVNELVEEPAGLATKLLETGLDSLSTTLVLTKIQQQFGIQLSLTTLSSLQTVQDLADTVSLAAPAVQPQAKQEKRRRKARRLVRRPRPGLPRAPGGGPPRGPTMAPGARVRIFGLQTHQELNGLGGVLVAFHLAEDRWHVSVGDSGGRLIREANLERLDYGSAAPGLVVLQAMENSPHTYFVHSLGIDMIPGAAKAVANAAAGHVCALLYDDEAFACESVPSLAALYVRRVLEEERLKGGSAGAPVTVAGASFGCPLAHEVAVQLADLGVGVQLLLFDLDVLDPPAGALALDGRRPWLGGQVEGALLFARSLGEQSWAEAEELRLLRQAPEARSADEVLMRLFWELLAPRGVGRDAMEAPIRKLAKSFDRLHQVTANYQPAAAFEGQVSFVLAPHVAAAAWDDFQAIRLCQEPMAE